MKRYEKKKSELFSFPFALFLFFLFCLVLFASLRTFLTSSTLPFSSSTLLNISSRPLTLAIGVSKLGRQANRRSRPTPHQSKETRRYDDDIMTHNDVIYSRKENYLISSHDSIDDDVIIVHFDVIFSEENAKLGDDLSASGALNENLRKLLEQRTAEYAPLFSPDALSVRQRGRRNETLWFHFIERFSLSIVVEFFSIYVRCYSHPLLLPFSFSSTSFHSSCSVPLTLGLHNSKVSVNALGRTSGLFQRGFWLLHSLPLLLYQLISHSLPLSFLPFLQPRLDDSSSPFKLAQPITAINRAALRPNEVDINSEEGRKVNEE
jgi:hypothetical protein